MYKILNDYTAPDLKESFRKANEYQDTYNLRDNDTNEAKQAESYSLYRADYM